MKILSGGFGQEPWDTCRQSAMDSGSYAKEKGHPGYRRALHLVPSFFLGESTKGVQKMSLTVNIYYTGKDGSALQFAKEMMQKGIVKRIREEEGNLTYEYFRPLEDPETVLLIDSWENQPALDKHHQSPMMKEIMELRSKYDLHMKVVRYREEDGIPSSDQNFIRS